MKPETKKELEEELDHAPREETLLRLLVWRTVSKLKSEYANLSVKSRDVELSDGEKSRMISLGYFMSVYFDKYDKL